jgi:hypothetical protein
VLTLESGKKITLISNINVTAVIVIIIPITFIVTTVLAVAFFLNTWQIIFTTNSQSTINNRNDMGKAMHKETGIVAFPQM